MPQLVKGGKHTFGWSRVGEEGQIRIPPDAWIEYRFAEVEYGYLLSGSRTSGGFGLTTLESLKASPFGDFLDRHPEWESPGSVFGKSIRYGPRVIAVVPIRGKSIRVPRQILTLYEVTKGDLLLTVRGSRLALGFIARGPIVKEARKHSGLTVFS